MKLLRHSGNIRVCGDASRTRAYHVHAITEDARVIDPIDVIASSYPKRRRTMRELYDRTGYVVYRHRLVLLLQ